jgi:4-amino-4-deoxy-L-arabinose transferase-like glycosyltransferase
MSDVRAPSSLWKRLGQALRGLRYSDRRLGLGLFLTSLSLFLLTDGGGGDVSIDVYQSIAVSKSIVKHFSVAISGFPLSPGGGAVLGTGGHQYATHDIGLAVLMLPISTLLQLWHLPSPVGFFLYTLVNPLLGAGIVCLLFFFSLQLTKNKTAAAGVAATAALCSILWPYTHLLFDATPTAFLLLLAFYALWRAQQRLATSMLFLASAALAGAMVFRVDSVLATIVGTIWFVTLVWRLRGWELLRAIAAWAIPLALALAVTGWYNWARFGSVFDDGHRHDPNTVTSTPIWYGFLGQLISPGKGLLIFVPPILIAIFGWRALAKRSRPLLYTVISLPLLYALVEGRYLNWSGNEAWGPRFLLPCVPLLLLPLAFVYDRWGSYPRALRGLFVGLLLLGAAVQLIGVTTNEAAVDRLNGGREQIAAWHSSQIWWSMGALNRTLHGESPVPSIAQGGVVPAPVPRLDVWWEGGLSSAETRPAPTWSIVGLLTILFLSGAGYCLALACPRMRRREEDEDALVSTA